DKDGGTTLKESPPKPAKPVPAPAKPKSSAPKEDAEEASELPSRELASKKDYQLNQALNLLKGMQIMKTAR
ncbi:MAG TPA: peptidase S41, partial [Candidatus Accumulibacter sp.]|nr:peptidase S41 [Accumulibacter sp.]HCV14055.1 peptidase S41 [Accumulibacter sp.]